MALLSHPPLAPLMTREGLRMGVRDAIDAFDLRDDSDGNRERVVVPASLCRALRNTVCGTTPSFLQLNVAHNFEAHSRIGLGTESGRKT